jgi:hypothetical protein
MKPEDIRLQAEYLEHLRRVRNHHKEELAWLRIGLILMPIFWAIIMLAMVLVMYK